MDILEFQQLLGLFIKCIERDVEEPITFQSIFENDDYERDRLANIDRLIHIADRFIDEHPLPHNPTENQTLEIFVQHWRERTLLGRTKKWPKRTPLLDLIYKLITWFPIFQEDPEFYLYLESFTSFINSVAAFSVYGGNLKRGTFERACVKKIYVEILKPILNNDLKINEELLEGYPLDRFNMMSIHQSKGLEFPIVIVDLRMSARRRFPRTAVGTYALEHILMELNQDLRDDRSALDHAFDDLIRLFYVAYSRARSALILLWDAPRRAGVFPSHVAVGYDRNEVHQWRGSRARWFELRRRRTGTRRRSGVILDYLL